jgi:hypothetical protein
MGTEAGSGGLAIDKAAGVCGRRGGVCAGRRAGARVVASVGCTRNKTRPAIRRPKARRVAVLQHESHAPIDWLQAACRWNATLHTQCPVFALIWQPPRDTARPSGSDAAPFVSSAPLSRIGRAGGVQCTGPVTAERLVRLATVGGAPVPR